MLEFDVRNKGCRFRDEQIFSIRLGSSWTAVEQVAREGGKLQL
jgi:hypothetical protein